MCLLIPFDDKLTAASGSGCLPMAKSETKASAVIVACCLLISPTITTIALLAT